VLEAVEEPGFSSFLNGAGLSARSPSLCSDGAGLSARSPSLCCESSADSNSAGLAACFPSLCCDSNDDDDVEQASLHCGSLSEPDMDLSGAE